jgi:hypothetical protein
MLFTPTFNFSQAEIKEAIKIAAGVWTGWKEVSSVSFSVDSSVPKGEEVRVHGSALIRSGQGKTTSFGLSHDGVVTAIAVASARKGNIIDPTTVKFKYSEGVDHHQASSTSATAKGGSQAPIAAEGAGINKATFPLPVKIRVDEKEIKEMLTNAVRRQNVGTVRYISLSHRGEEKLPFACVGLNTKGQDSTVELSYDELCGFIKDELISKGAVVVSVTAKYNPGGGYGNAASVSASAEVTAFPLSEF